MQKKTTSQKLAGRFVQLSALGWLHDSLFFQGKIFLREVKTGDIRNALFENALISKK